MHFRDFGALLWALVVMVGVVSSVIKAAGKAKVPSAARLGEPLSQAPNVVAAAPKQRRSVAVKPEVASLLAGIDQAYRSILAAPVPEPAAEPAEQPAMTPPIASFADFAAAVPSQSSPARGRRTDWARGVVVAELLAPPLAMRESGPPTW